MTLPEHKRWSLLFGAWTLHGVIALLQFLSLSSGGNFSSRRALIFGVLLLWTSFSALLTLSAFIETRLFSFFTNLIAKPKIKDVFFAAASFALVARIGIAFLQMLFQSAGDFKYSGYAQNLAPFLNLLSFVSLEIIALVLFFTFRNWKEDRKTIASFASRLGVTLLVLTFASLLVYFTGWGVIPGYKGDWSRGIPAVALLEWQIILACWVSVGMILLEEKQNSGRRFDLWVSAAIWIFAAALWLSQPVMPNSSALEPRAPNFEIYPFNDAQIYDGYAQSAMIGNGYGAEMIPQRPLYIVLLIALHVIAGQNYESVIFAQSLLLAFFPVLLYLFGKEFFGRPIGISIALLAILRDFTSNIAAPFTGNLSYTKLYLSEIPTAMMLILFLLIGVRWVKRGFPSFDGFLMGGILGVGILIRTQVAVALPVLILFALLTRPKLIRSALKSSALGILAVMIVVSPWLARNWRMTGHLLFDNPASQTANLALRYSRVNGHNANITQMPGESNSDYNSRMLLIAKEAVNENPFAIGREIASAFINHGINNILLFPLRYDLESPGELWKPTKAFWQWWHGGLNLLQSFLLGFYIFLFGLGVAFAWQKIGWLGLLPLGVNLAYNLWTSIALLSGQRFMLTMDWSAYMYYMIGLFASMSIFLFALEGSRASMRNWYARHSFAFIEYAENTSWRKYLFAGFSFFIVGASLWGAEMIFPQRYPLISQTELVNKILSSPGLELDAVCFQKTIAENDLHLVQGRALYPRYYEAGEGETFTDAYGYKKSDQNRIVFEMVGQLNQRVVFQAVEPIGFFPNAADVTLALDHDGNRWFLFVQQGGKTRMYFSDAYPPCP